MIVFNSSKVLISMGMEILMKCVTWWEKGRKLEKKKIKKQDLNGTFWIFKREIQKKYP